MGKTVGAIVAVGAAVAVNLIPGVGSAISTFLLTSTPLTLSASAFLGPALVAGITAGGVLAGASLLGLGPSIPKPDTTSTMVKIPRPPRVSAYGISRLSGTVVFHDGD